MRGRHPQTLAIVSEDDQPLRRLARSHGAPWFQVRRARIVEDLDVEAIRLGDPLGETAGLIKSGETSGVYFIDGTTRRQVANPQVMDKYRFAWERVRDVPCEEMARWPRGETLR